MEPASHYTYQEYRKLLHTFVNYGSKYYARKDRDLIYAALIRRVMIKRLLERNVSLEEVSYATGFEQMKLSEMAAV